MSNQLRVNQMVKLRGGSEYWEETPFKDMVEKVGKICEKNGDVLCVSFDINGNEQSFWFPYYVLELTDQEKPDFEVYEKVLVRDSRHAIWEPRFFARSTKESYGYRYYATDGIYYQYCIKYKGNEHLVGTKDKP